MKNEIIKTAVGLVMNKKVRTTVKVISGLMWLMEKGIDVYDGYANKLDEQIMISNLVEESLKDEMGIKKMAQEEAKKEVRREIAKAMAASGTKNDEINAFLRSLNETKAS